MTAPSNFVLAFGGTGARCAEALAYLAAARVLTDPTYVLIVDPDENNGNTNQAAEQLKRYHGLRATLTASAGGVRRGPFFGTTLNVPPDDPSASRGADSFKWKYGSASRSWSDILEGEAGGGAASARALYEVLYDDDDMAMTFEQGYVGRAHIGALDVYLTFRRAAAPDAVADEMSRFLTALEGAAKHRVAKLSVVGSIFGGTGASGIPAVPPFLLGQSRFEDQAGSLRLAAVQLAPYFSFTASEDATQPDSRLHPVATQSALFHYGTTSVGYDRVYLVGAPERSQTAPAVARGGPDQRNRAHYAEVAAALAMVHSFESPPAERLPATMPPRVFASYAGQTGYLDFPGFPGYDGAHLRRDVVAFTTACALHAMYLAPTIATLGGQNFMRVMREQTRGVLEQGNREFDAFTAFAQRYLAWIVEVNASADGQLLTTSFPGFADAFLRAPDTFWQTRKDGAPLAAVDPLVDAEALRGMKSPYAELVDRRMNTVKEGQIAQRTPMGFYLALLTAAADDYCSRIYKSWT